MLQRSNKLNSAFALIALTLIVFNSCKNPVDGISIAISTNTINKSPTLVQFVNANAKSTIPIPANIQVTIGGSGASFVQTDGGGKKFIANNGVLPLSLDRFATPSVSNPIEFTISAEIEGYAPIFHKFVITSDTLKQSLQIPLLAYNNPASGTSAVLETDLLVAGITPVATAITLPSTAKTLQSVDIVVPAGTQMLDANNQIIPATSLKTTVVYYGTNDAEAYKAYAPNLTSKNVIGRDKKPVDKQVTFITAGVVSINMVAGTSAVKSFSKPVLTSIEINAELNNPNTGLPVKVGEAIPIWSLNEQTGQWTYEKTTNIIRNTDGNLAVEFEISHLSSWGALFDTLPCTTPTKVLIDNLDNLQVRSIKSKIPSSSAANGYASFPIELTVSTPNKQVLSVFEAFVSGASMRIELFNLPVYPNATLSIRSPTGDMELYEVKVFPTCGFTLAPIPLLKVGVDIVDTEISFLGKCTSKKIVVFPTTWMVLSDVTDGTSSSIYMNNGKVNASLVNGHSYNILASYAGTTYKSQNIKVDKVNGINVSNAAGLKVTGQYNSETKKLPLAAEFTVTTCN